MNDGRAAALPDNGWRLRLVRFSLQSKLALGILRLAISLYSKESRSIFDVLIEGFDCSHVRALAVAHIV